MRIKYGNQNLVIYSIQYNSLLIKINCYTDTVTSLTHTIHIFYKVIFTTNLGDASQTGILYHQPLIKMHLLRYIIFTGLDYIFTFITKVKCEENTFLPLSWHSGDFNNLSLLKCKILMTWHVVFNIDFIFILILKQVSYRSFFLKWQVKFLH